MNRVGRWGWVRTIGAGLTLAGTAVVFVLLIFPTSAAADHGNACKTDDGSVQIFSFTPHKAKAGSDTVVTIYGQHLDVVEDVILGGTTAKNQSNIDNFTYVDNTIQFTVPADAHSGKIAVGTTTSPCLAWSGSSLRV